MKKPIMTIAALAITLSTYAQSELAGNWTFQGQESISGNLYSNGSPKSVKITIKDGTITFEKVTAGNGPDVTTTETLCTDKAFETTTASKRKKTITLKKQSSGYTEFMTLYSAADATKIDHKQTDTWTIDNGQLVLDRKDENLTNGETWESKAFYHN